MANLFQNVPKLPKKLAIIENSEKILLPGLMKIFSTQDSKIKTLLESKLKRKQNGTIPTFIGVAPSFEVGIIGTAATINKVTNDSAYLIGICRFQIVKIISNDPYPEAEITQLDMHRDCDVICIDPKIIELVKHIEDVMNELLQIESTFLKETLNKIPACYLSEMCSHLINFSYNDQLTLLNTLDVSKRLEITLNILKMKHKEGYKRPRVIIRARNPLSNLGGSQNTEFLKLQERIKQIKFPSNVETIVQSELKDLSMLMPINPQYHVLFTHLSLIADLPWNKCAKEIIDLRKTENDLEADHYGLNDVKKRILEYLAVRKLRSSSSSFSSPVICLVGPPGVGKTSIARSIATTLSRPFARVSLGGVNNMSDIRGHRKAYVGAMPGRIIQAIKRSGVKNPVILLDEIDKMTFGINGDPAAALLEVLDPAQNKEFFDHYLNIPFDLSHVLFIATANMVKKLSPALFDRLEIIRISGYTYIEKVQIAMKYLLPKQLNENGLNKEQIQIPEETIQLLINNYTYEAGVRSLERKIGNLCRAIAVKVALNETVDNTNTNFPFIVDIAAAKNILGSLLRENNKWVSRLGRPGVAVGLVVNSAGGDTQAVESCFMPGSGKLILTGSLGTVMKESAQLAWGWVRANAQMYGVDLDGKRLKSIDVHVHFPEGAVSKDGPSAGVTIAATLMSLFLDRPLLTNIAMTGEITLQGLVLPVGGVKEKVIAAHRDGFNKIILPQKNVKHLDDIPACIKDDLNFVLVSDIHTVMETIFEGGVNLVMGHCIKSKL